MPPCKTPEPEGVHGQLEGFNRNLRPKAAVANTTIWHQTTLVDKCIIPFLILCQYLGQIGPVVQEKTPKNRHFCYEIYFERSLTDGDTNTSDSACEQWSEEFV